MTRKARGQRRPAAVISVALAQAHNDDAEAAQATLLSARMVGREINRGYSRAYALSHISRNQAAIGAIDDARETANEVDRATLRAVALWAVAASPARHCDSVASCEDETLAFSAIRNLKDKLVRITLLSDIAVAYSRAGDRGRAIMLFDEALAYAVNLDKPWVRARALSRLATTLSEIR